ncbi:MAG: Uma2 family endonuclease [Hyphomicrobiaceae bacterium]|nr:Uma2 family endonuclease [Hyphomicrobiaceae bacterium]
MNAFTPVSKEQFYRFLETRIDERYEYEGGLIVQQMAGGTRRHSEVAKRIMRAWDGQLARANWVILNERGVETPDRVRFADVVVEPADEPDDSLAATRPVIIVEVLSPSSKAYDLKIKPTEYLGIPTLDVYMVASQTEPAVRFWQRSEEGTFPTEPVEIEGLSQRLTLACRPFAVTLDLAEIYDGLCGPLRE